jgi:hypothetical protein
MNINKYRDLCRRLIQECRHPEMTRARKLVLLKLADLIDGREGYTAYPAFNTLAEYAGVSRDTAIRAVNIGKKIGLLIRVKGAGKRGLGGTSNRYGFRLKEVADVLPLSDAKEVAGVPLKRSQACIERSSRPATQQSNDNLIDSLKDGSASAAALESVVGVASLPSEDSISVQTDNSAKRRSGEEGNNLPVWTTASLTEIEYTPGLRKLYERATDNLNPLAQPNLTASQTSGFVPRGASATSTTTPTHFTYEEAQALGLGPPAPRFQKIRARW